MAAPALHLSLGRTTCSTAGLPSSFVMASICSIIRCSRSSLTSGPLPAGGFTET